uniref:MIT domain-containing protein n=1 Tax=Rhizophora mucronata TaxID=61149 RepID=A0A2P2M128_RHIMU
MSFLRAIIDSLGSVFTSYSSQFEPQQNPSSASVPPMDATVPAGPAGGSNERAAYKLKGYFDLAKEEIAKAVRAEEWGLTDDAVAHYTSARRILLEASSTPSPSYISRSEQEKVKSYRQKISKWQGQVSERLQVLNGRAGLFNCHCDLF